MLVIGSCIGEEDDDDGHRPYSVRYIVVVYGLPGNIYVITSCTSDTMTMV